MVIGQGKPEAIKHDGWNSEPGLFHRYELYKTWSSIIL